MIHLSSYYHAFIVEAVCNEVDAKDDGCFTLRHNIIPGKMIPWVPAGAQLSRRLNSIAVHCFIRKSTTI